MGRVNRYRFKFIDDGRWADYGKWLEWQRGFTELTQEEVAKALGISRMQWIRYTQGARVPKKRIEKMIEVLGLPAEKAYLRAGYEAPPDLTVWVDAHLRRIRDTVLRGELAGALVHLISFYYDSNEEKKRYKTILPSTAASDFVTAAVAIHRMPDWLRDEFLIFLLINRKGIRKYESFESPERMEEIRKLIRAELPELRQVKLKTIFQEYRNSKKRRGA